MYKLINFLTIFLLLILDVIAQENNASPSVEVFIGTKGLLPFGSTTTTEYLFEAIGTVWARTDGDVCYESPDNLCYMNGDFLNGSYTTIGNSKDIDGWEGIDFYHSPSNFATNEIAYGLYKISVKDKNLHFYLDWRDSDYPYSATGGAPGGNDMWLKYEANLEKISYSVDKGTNWQALSNGGLISIWGIKGRTANTFRFSNFWNNALVLIAGENNPIIVWAPHPTMSNITSYKIYRSVTPYGGSPSRFYPYSLLATVDASTFEYTKTQEV